MLNTNFKLSSQKPVNIFQILIISLIALLFAHLIILPNTVFLFLGILITSYFIYQNTLGKGDKFSFIMVMYFCSAFPYLIGMGGAFNLISLICIGLYYILNKKLPAEKRLIDPWFKWFIILFILSSIFGWILNFAGSIRDLIFSIWSFFGLIFLLLLSSRLDLTPERIKVFLRLNFVLIIYSTIASLNAIYHFFPFTTPMMPIYKELDEGYIETGGIIGISPFYGEYSMILAILFAVFLILGTRNQVSILLLTLGMIISFLNVFMSISRSVFMLGIFGVVLILIFQYKLNRINIPKQILQIIAVVLLGYGTLWIIEQAGFDYVFDRVEQIEEVNREAGGITINRIIDGSAFNRETAFEEGYKRYASKNSWIFGYGWGLLENNRIAYFVDPNIKRGSAHSQIIAILFIFGWTGFIGYWGLILRAIYRSYKTISRKDVNYLQRLLSYFFMISLILFVFNEVKVDSSYYPTYFAVTIIWLGLAFSVVNYRNQKSLQMPIGMK